MRQQLTPKNCHRCVSISISVETFVIIFSIQLVAQTLASQCGGWVPALLLQQAVAMAIPGERSRAAPLGCLKVGR